MELTSFVFGLLYGIALTLLLIPFIIRYYLKRKLNNIMSLTKLGVME